MRRLAAFAVAIAAAMVCSEDIHSAEARIEGCEFGCDAPNGTRFKPEPGDVEGVVYTCLPAERQHCLRTLKRKIDLSGENIVFEVDEKIDEHVEGFFPDIRTLFLLKVFRCRISQRKLSIP